jgi:hypothetical protein
VMTWMSLASEDGVEVDQAAALELRNLGVGQLHCPGPGDPSGFGEVTADGDGGAPPQLRGVRVPHHSAVVVVAVWAQRPAQARGCLLVPQPARQAPAVRADGLFTAGRHRAGRPLGCWRRVCTGPNEGAVKVANGAVLFSGPLSCSLEPCLGRPVGVAEQSASRSPDAHSPGCGAYPGRGQTGPVRT